MSDSTANVEALYQALQSAQVYRDATGRLLSLEEIAQFLRNPASQATGLNPSDMQGSIDSEPQAGRTLTSPLEVLDGSQSAPSLHSSVRTTESKE